MKTEVVKNLARARMVALVVRRFYGKADCPGSEDAVGRFLFHGRKELIEILRKLEPKHLTWKRYAMMDWNVLERATS